MTDLTTVAGDPSAAPVTVDLDGWRQHAACDGLDPDLFFPSRGDTFGVREAKAVCALCFVREACLEYALDNGEAWGIWGGKSERERRRMRTSRRADRRAAELATADRRVSS